jgi:KaiC/GvpD/RAD55 family RecA-like ATPase
MESLSTGIEGLDMLIDGGYPKGKSILVTGPPGAGKLFSGFISCTEAARKARNAY